MKSAAPFCCNSTVVSAKYIPVMRNHNSLFPYQDPYGMKNFWIQKKQVPPVGYEVLEPGLHEMCKHGLELEEDRLLVNGLQVHCQQLLRNPRY